MDTSAPGASIDLIIFGLLCVLFLDGVRKGFLRVIFGPLAFAVSVICGILYFDFSGNIPMSLMVTILGTIGLSTLLGTIHFFGKKTLDEPHRNYVFWGSRLLGGIVTLIWKGGIIACFTVLIPMIPLSLAGPTKLQMEIVSSKSYKFSQHYVIPHVSPVRNLMTALSVLTNFSRFQQISEGKEFTDFFGDPRVVAVLSDPSLSEETLHEDLWGFFTDERVRLVVTDDELMKKLTKLSKRVYQEGIALREGR